MARLLALDFGGSSVKFGIVDDNAEISAQGKVPAPLASREQFAQTIRDLYAPLKGKVDGIAISMPGMVDPQTGAIGVAGAYSQTMTDANIYEMLADIDVPISVENDGLAATQAELWVGTLREAKNGAVLVLGSGLGGGVVIDGKVRRTSRLAAGSLGLQLANPGNYDMQGLMGLRAATSGLLMGVAVAKGLSPEQFDISGAIVEREEGAQAAYTGKDVFRWIDEGDEPTVATYQNWLRDLAMVAYNLTMILDADVIAIGGGVSRNPRLVADLRAELEPVNQMVSMMGLAPAKVVACSFDADANLIGAVATWLELHK